MTQQHSSVPPSERASSATRSEASGLERRYLHAELLGQGGMAEVYKVEDTRRGAWVALKCLHRTLAADLAERAKRLLEAEYHTLKQLQHPSIIEVYEYGVDSELGPYYTMELLSGQDLRELAPLPWREACRVLIDVASSLAVVHSRRLLHRDITPRNVRRTADGRAKLLDFGALTEMGVTRELVGTPAYVPPEALHQQSLDGRADLYSLGALAYFALTGRHAFHANSFQDLRELWEVRPISVCRYDDEIPQGLNTLVMSLLQPEPLARPQSAAEVMDRLSALADLPLGEDAAVAHAYLTAPRLIAREEATQRIRKQLARTARGRGGTLLIEGAAGVGRSRLLDTCVLEAQLAGTLVVRAECERRRQGVWRRAPARAAVARGEAQLARAAGRAWAFAADHEQRCGLGRHRGAARDHRQAQPADRADQSAPAAGAGRR
jgi:tRNA A-37 threonylcarbamoyl transferase component Bud32